MVQGPVKEDIDVVDEGEGCEPKVASVVDSYVERQVNSLPLKVHGLIGTDVDESGAVTDHVTEVDCCRASRRISENSQLCAAINLKLIKPVSVVPCKNIKRSVIRPANLWQYFAEKHHHT